MQEINDYDDARARYHGTDTEPAQSPDDVRDERLQDDAEQAAIWREIEEGKPITETVRQINLEEFRK